MVSVWVYNVVFNYVQNHEDAEEITQDTLMSAIKAIDSFKQESALKTWVYGIAINKSRDFLKYKSRKKRNASVISIYDNDAYMMKGEGLSLSHPGTQLESKEQMDILFRGINQLPENQKEALILSKLDGQSQKEVAEIMKISSKAVESLVSRAKENLKKYLEVEGIVVYKKMKKIIP